MNSTTTTARTIDLGDGLQVSVDERGGPATAPETAILLLHGGAGPQSVAGLAAALSAHAHVVTPVHPGFDGTPRPPWLDSAAALADAYLDLLDALSLDAVTVIGNSIGGWIASEMALRDIHGRIASLVLLNANGIRPDNAGQVTDIRGLPPEEVGRLAFHNPAYRLDPATLSPQQRAGMAANQQALALYAGEQFMFAPGLRRRLRRVTVPVLVAWGEEDRVVTADYGRAYAAAFRNGRFQALAQAGHLPQVEQPAAVLAAVEGFTRDLAGPGDD